MNMNIPARIRAAAAPVLGAAAVTLAVAAPAQAAAAAPPPARPAPVLVACQGAGHVRPRHYVIACADNGLFLVRMHWSSWGSAAAGRGYEWVNDCTPNCAEGTFHRFDAVITLARARRWPAHPGQRYFTRLTVTYPRAIPAGFHRTQTQVLSPSA